MRLSAPPGYGKSALVRFFATRFEGHALCDCAGISGIADFAHRVMSALGDEIHGETVTATRMRLLAAGADDAAWTRHLLEAWKASQPDSLFVFENADAIALDGELLLLLGELLAARPAQRAVLISSREPLALRYTHYFAPHHVLALTAGDLRCDFDDALNVFEGTGASTGAIARILALTGGRPVTVQLLARFANYEADFEGLIDRLETVTFAERHEYLLREVLTALPPAMRAALIAIVAIPRASLDDVAAAIGIAHPMAIVDRLQRLPGFVSAEAGTYRAHSLVRELILREHEAEFGAHLDRAARENERVGDYLRAAELRLECRDETAAARALDRLPAATLAQPSARVVDVLARISMPVLCEFPNLWCALLPQRKHLVEPARLYDEASELLRRCPAGAVTLQQRLRVRIAAFAQAMGKLVEARILLERRAPPHGNDDPEERRLALMTSALIAAKQGRFGEADRFVEEANAVHGSRRTRFDAERAEIARERAHLMGDWDGLLKMHEDALTAAQRSGVTARVIDAARGVVAAAWYCNDDARAASALQLLEACDDPQVRTFSECVAASVGGIPVAAPARLLAIARWHAALATVDAERARTLFDAAIDGVDAVENEFLRVTIRVSAALVLPSARRRLLEARLIAGNIESPPLLASLEMLIDSPRPTDFGIFKHIAMRAARSPLKLRRDVLCLEIASGRALRGGNVLRVSERDFELLAALALLPPGTSKEQLAATIWPALDGDAALNALKMCVSRTRAQVGDKEAIVSTKRGYSLSEQVAVDVHDAENLSRGLRGLESLGDAGRTHAAEALRRIGAPERLFAPRWTWFAPYRDRIVELHHELTLALERDAYHPERPQALEMAVE